MADQPTALVTGSTGFIGKYVVRELLQADFEVATLARGEQADIRCDLSSDEPDFDNRRFNLVVHVAGTTDESLADAVNNTGTRNLAKSLEKNPPESFVFISSASVYGVTEGENINESHPLAPTTEYGHSKLAAEQFLTEWAKRNAVRLTILRPAMVVGTGMTGQLMKMARGINNGTYFNIKENTARRSLVHAIDVARTARLASAVGGIFNLTDGNDPLIVDLSEALAFRIKGKRIPTISMRRVRLAARFGDFLRGHFPIDSKRLDKLTCSLTFDSSRLRAATDWQPIDVVDYLRTHDYENDGLEF